VSECASESAGSGSIGGSRVHGLEDDSYVSDQLYHGNRDNKDDEVVVSIVGQGTA
jgi:hypothetical protein